MRDGKGTYTWPDGTKYVGEWKNDKFNGQGIFTYADNRELKGMFKNNEFIQ